ncbi:MAG: DUF4340 domain-containing protein [Pseudomonadota bacterium]
MKKSILINLALLLVVAALALLVIFEPGIEGPKEQPSLLQFEREAVEHILIHRQGQPTIELEREPGGTWQLLQPLKAAADDYRTDSLLRVTDTKSRSRFTVEKGGLADYALDKPRVVLELNHTTRIAFGAQTPLDQRRYVRLGDSDTVHLINDTLYYHLIGTFPGYINKRPLPGDASIQALTLPQLSLRWQEKRWQVEPEPDNYSADRVTRLLDGWKYASALSVEEYDGMEGEPVSILLKGREAPLEFLLTAREPDFILARPELGIQYRFPAESGEEMLSLPQPQSTQEPVE